MQKTDINECQLKERMSLKIAKGSLKGSTQDPVEPKIISAQQNRKNPF
jgi:hypothetical protein